MNTPDRGVSGEQRQAENETARRRKPTPKPAPPPPPEPEKIINTPHEMPINYMRVKAWGSRQNKIS